MTINRAFGAVLVEILKKKNISKLEFSRMTKISRSSLYKIIDGKQSPSLDTIYNFSKHLGLCPGQILYYAYIRMGPIPPDENNYYS